MNSSQNQPANANQLANLARCLNEAGRIVGDLSASANAAATPGTRNMDSAIGEVTQAVNRARAMVHSSSSNSNNRGLFSRLTSRERLRAVSNQSLAGKSKKPKALEKTFEVVLMKFEDGDAETYLLDDECMALRGFVTLNSHMDESAIRSCLAELLQKKYPTLAPQDVEFLKANRRRLSKPVFVGQLTFKEVKLLAGQGCIYLKVKDGFEFLLEGQSQQDEESDCPSNNEAAAEFMHGK